MSHLILRFALVATLLAAIAPAPVAAQVGESNAPDLSYSVVATGTVNRALTQMRLDTTLTITAPVDGLTRLVLGVAPRGLRAWTSETASIDGRVTNAVRWTDTMGLTFDLSVAPWEPGSIHTVRVVGTIDWTRSADRQGRLRRVGSTTYGGVTLTAGDFLPLPIERAYHPTFSDSLSAFVADSITFTLKVDRDIRGRGVALAGTHLAGPTDATIGRRWSSRIEHARSYAFVLSQTYRSTATTVTLPLADGSSGQVRVRAVGPWALGRSVDLTTAVRALTDLSSRFGPGPYRDYTLVSVTAGGFAHEFPGLVFIGSSFRQPARKGVINHEVAHQWWYALSANDQAEDSWMDESLANYSQSRLAGATSAPAANCSRPIDGPNRVDRAYYLSFFGTDSLWQCVYKRGLRFWMALGETVGFTHLDRCLADYLAANRFVRRGTVVLAQWLRDCGAAVGHEAEVLTLLRRYLSAPTVDAMR